MLLLSAAVGLSGLLGWAAGHHGKTAPSLGRIDARSASTEVERHLDLGSGGGSVTACAASTCAWRYDGANWRIVFYLDEPANSTPHGPPMRDN